MDWSWSRSTALGVERPDHTGPLNTNLYILTYVHEMKPKKNRVKQLCFITLLDIRFPTLTLGMRRHPHWLVKHSACIIVVDSKTRCWIICVAAIAILASASRSPAALLVMGVHLGIGSRRRLGHHVQCWAKYYFTLVGQMCTGECAVGGE